MLRCVSWRSDFIMYTKNKQKSKNLLSTNQNRWKIDINRQWSTYMGILDVDYCSKGGIIIDKLISYPIKGGSVMGASASFAVSRITLMLFKYRNVSNASTFEKKCRPLSPVYRWKHTTGCHRKCLTFTFIAHENTTLCTLIH